MAADVPPLRYRSAKARSAGPANGPIVALSDELGGSAALLYLDIAIDAGCYFVTRLQEGRQPPRVCGECASAGRPDPDRQVSCDKPIQERNGTLSEMGLWKEHFHWSVLLNWSVLAATVPLVLGVAGLLLFFDQYAITNACFVISFAFIFAKLAQVAVKSTDSAWSRIVFTFIFFGMFGVALVESVRGVNTYAAKKRLADGTGGSAQVTPPSNATKNIGDSKEPHTPVSAQLPPPETARQETHHVEKHAPDKTTVGVSQTMVNSPGGIQAGGNLTVVPQEPPRRLTAEQQVWLANFFKGHKAATLVVACDHKNGNEPCGFASQIADALKSAGWAVSLAPGLIYRQFSHNKLPDIDLRMHSNSGTDAAYDAAGNLQRALETLTGHSVPASVDVAVPENTIRLTVYTQSEGEQ